MCGFCRHSVCALNEHSFSPLEGFLQEILGNSNRLKKSIIIKRGEMWPNILTVVMWMNVNVVSAKPTWSLITKKRKSMSFYYLNKVCGWGTNLHDVVRLETEQSKGGFRLCNTKQDTSSETMPIIHLTLGTLFL